MNLAPGFKQNKQIQRPSNIQKNYQLLINYKNILVNLFFEECMSAKKELIINGHFNFILFEVKVDNIDLQAFIATQNKIKNFQYQPRSYKEQQNIPSIFFTDNKL